MRMSKGGPAKIDRRRLIRNLQKAISVKSFGFHEEEMGQLMGDLMAQLGMQVQTQEVQGSRFNVLGTLKGCGASGANLMYNGHIDTNPPGEGWSVDPFKGVVDDHCICGLGVANMKAGNIAFLEALNSLLESGWKSTADLIMAQVIGELQGGIGTRHMLETGVRANYFIVGEPTDLGLLTMHAGSVELKIMVHGKLRHLSKMEEGINAIKKAARIISTMDASLLNASGLDETRRALFRLNVGSIKGGISQSCIDYRPALVPDYCELNVAARIPPGRDDNDVLSDFGRYLSNLSQSDPDLKAEAQLERQRRIFMPPFMVSETDPFVRLVCEAHLNVVGEIPKIGSLNPYRYGGTDAGHLSTYGMTGVVYGPGGRYTTMPDERVELQDLFHAAEIYSQVIAKSESLLQKD
jgi:acetylornithine deacetylase